MAGLRRDGFSPSAEEKTEGPPESLRESVAGAVAKITKGGKIRREQKSKGIHIGRLS
jgi:hypothetical protein